MSVEDRYNSIGVDYQNSKYLPFRKCVEEFTIFQLLGDVTGKKVLDLACGAGHYSRILKQKGAANVVGVDISPTMIQLAEEEEKSNPIGCSYICSDAADIDVIDEFDLVIGIYLAEQADTKEKMLMFTKNANKNLKRGGSYVGIEMLNCQHPSDGLSDYGMFLKTKDLLKEGDLMELALTNQDGSTFKLYFYYWSETTIDAVFNDAGFSSFRFEGPLLDPSLASDWPNNYWDKFMVAKGIVGLFAIKP